MNIPALPPLDVLERSFTPSAWAAGEDYVLQERVRDLRRAGHSLAGKVLGVRDDYWARCEMSESRVSACSCGRPHCRHAAAILQAYYARKVSAKDADAAIDQFLSEPRRAPLVAAALGEDLLEAFSLPPERAEDLASLPDELAVLRVEEALQASSDTEGLLLALLGRAREGPLRDLAQTWLSDLAREPGAWLRLYLGAPDAWLDPLRRVEPEEWPEGLQSALLAALWSCAAIGGDRLRGVARVAARQAPGAAYWALHSLLRDHPEVLEALLSAAASCGRLGRAIVWALRCAEQLPPDQREAALSEMLAACEGREALRAELLMRRAALVGDGRALLAARRAALTAGNWPRLRRLTPTLLRGRPDAITLETRLLLADGDVARATEVAARARSSSLPERLVAEAMRARSPAEAKEHELRAGAIAQRLGEEAEEGGAASGPQEDHGAARKD